MQYTNTGILKMNGKQFNSCFKEQQKNVEVLLHHGGWDSTAVLNRSEGRGQVSRIGRFYNLLVPVDHIQVTVELLSDFFGQLWDDREQNKLKAQDNNLLYFFY